MKEATKIFFQMQYRHVLVEDKKVGRSCMGAP